MVDKGIIYYTDNRVREPIFTIVQKILSGIGLPITSVSLKPIDFGNNIVLKNRERSYPTMVTQITMALENSLSKYVFFCENDVLYPKSHFDFTPFKDDVFYYNTNILRWRTWDKMRSLSCMCCNREFGLAHYRKRMEWIEKEGLDVFRSREPRKARIWGYEPGTKPRRRGGFSDDVCDDWQSDIPVVDIRHNRTFSSPKVKIEEFIHPPTGWKEMSIEDIPFWNLREMFGL